MMSRFERVLLVIMVLLAAGIWIAVGYNVVSAWKAPLGPTMVLPTPKPSTTPGPTAIPLEPRPTVGPTTTMLPGHPTLTPFVATPVVQPQCGGPKTMLLLAIGSDSRANGYTYGLADVTRLVRVDFVTPRVTVLDFPRDLWVEIPDISEHYGITHGKLNQAYLYGNKGMGYYKGEGQGPGLLARTLDLNFGAQPEHYFAANMHVFVRLVDVIGGLDVYLPHSVDGRKADQMGRADLYFKAGYHHLNGQQALILARLRQQGVFERSNQQNIVLCAVRKALLNPYNLPKLPEIIKTFKGAVQTDLSPEQIGQLACLLTKLKPNNIAFVTFPNDLLKGTRTFDISMQKDVFIWDADFNVLRTYVSSFNTGLWPVPVMPLQPTTTPGPLGVSDNNFTCP